MIAATPGFRAIGEAPQEGLAAAKRRPPDLMLLDVGMPGMDGIETARRLWAARPQIVILLVTAGAPVDNPLAAGTCGAAAIVRKRDLAPRTLRSLCEVHASSGLGSG